MGVGEPLESPNAIRYLAQIRDKETWLYSSGVPLNREKTRGLINAGLDYLMLSFEGSSALGMVTVMLITFKNSGKRFRWLKT